MSSSSSSSSSSSPSPSPLSFSSSPASSSPLSPVNVSGRVPPPLSPNSVPVDSLWVSALKDIVAGTVGGMTTVVVGHPLDTVKVRLQTSTSHYTSMVDCIVKTWQVEGVRGYYKGVQSPLAGEAFFNAVQFLAYGQAKQLLSRLKEDGDAIHVPSRHAPNSPVPLPPHVHPPVPLSVSDYFVAGALTGAASCLVECPVDLLKSQLQTVIYRVNPPFTTFTEAVQYIVRQRGIQGLYQGLFPTFARTIPSTAAYFGCYEWVRASLTAREPLGRVETEAEHSAVILIAGGVGGFAYWLSTYPADSVKSAMQSDDIFPAQRRFQSTMDCVRQLWQEGGWRRFYRGLAPCLIRSVPANAACFWAYEYVTRTQQPTPLTPPPRAHLARPQLPHRSALSLLLCSLLLPGQASAQRLNFLGA